MKSNDVVTLHAIGERCSPDHLKKQVAYLDELPYLTQGLDATNSMILILNTCRQVVFANKAFLAMVNRGGSVELVGQRTGEIINCIYACDEIDGCSTAEVCKDCGGGNAILHAMETKKEFSGEFSNRNTMHGYEQNINLSIHVAPLPVKDEIFYVVSLADNSDSVKRRIMERTFFHDIINTVGALKGIVGLLKEDVSDNVKPEVQFVEEYFKYLVEEILAQKYMMDAEDNKLVLEMTSMETIDILQSVSRLYEGHDVTTNKTITLDEFCINKELHTDQRLLRRILGNMVKNALEVSDKGDVVVLGCSMDKEQNEWIIFWVHNDAYMDQRVQNRVFQRSFSTKGADRGLGTYSMKLFGETFLKGQVGFSTNKKRGTRFYIKLPLK